MNMRMIGLSCLMVASCCFAEVDDYLLITVPQGDAKCAIVSTNSIQGLVRSPDQLVMRKLKDSESYIADGLITRCVWERVTGRYPELRNPFMRNGYLPGEAPKQYDLPATDIEWNSVEKEFLPAINEKAPAGWRFDVPTVNELVSFLGPTTCEKLNEKYTWVSNPRARNTSEASNRVTESYWEWTSDVGEIEGTEQTLTGPGLPSAKAHVVVLGKNPASNKLLFKVGNAYFTGGTLGVRLVASKE